MTPTNCSHITRSLMSGFNDSDIKHLDEALSLLSVGGIYFIDDLLPQPNWPQDHAPKVPALINDLENREKFEVTKLDWASGLMIVVRTAP